MSKFYYKEKVIGSGTFGNVWLVKSKTSNRSFVLKEVNLASMNATETQRALTEVTILSRCRHKNIIKYEDAIIDHKKGMLSIFMEYADGGDLYTAITKQKGVPFKEHAVIVWFIQICLALQYIHHKDIIHRDLKTRNIFLTRDKQIKIGDFGIARCLMETNELVTTSIGTPFYLSPEICNQKPYNHKSDMWAVGCILFEMTALSHPFQASNFPQLLTLIITGQRKQLPRHSSSLVKDLVQKLLDENPKTRPSADEILDLPCLQQYLSEMWTIQNTNDSTSLGKILHKEITSRRHSLCNVERNSNGSPAKRRASISVVDTRGTRTRFGFVIRRKNPQTSKLVTASRLSSVKGYNSPNKSDVKREQFLTYKVLNPVTLKERITNILYNGLKISRAETGITKYSMKSCDLDCGYQSKQSLKCSSNETHDFEASGSITQSKSSTKRRIEVSEFKVAEGVENDDVFESSINQMRGNKNFLTVSKNPHPGCSHSQCQQCIMDIMWKNRIRGTIGSFVKTEEKSELIRKLQAVFGEDLFDTVYNDLICNWEDLEKADTPISFIDITHRLNYSQLQHLPLMMQLIQLDVVPK